MAEGELFVIEAYQVENGGVEVVNVHGIGLGAPIRLREIRVGPIVVRDMRALVNKAPMSSSLLGIDFLERLSSYSVKDGVLTMRR